MPHRAKEKKEVYTFIVPANTPPLAVDYIANALRAFAESHCGDYVASSVDVRFSDIASNTQVGRLSGCARRLCSLHRLCAAASHT